MSEPTERYNYSSHPHQFTRGICIVLDTLTKVTVASPFESISHLHTDPGVCWHSLNGMGLIQTQHPTDLPCGAVGHQQCWNVHYLYPWSGMSFALSLLLFQGINTGSMTSAQMIPESSCLNKNEVPAQWSCNAQLCTAVSELSNFVINKSNWSFVIYCTVLSMLVGS